MGGGAVRGFLSFLIDSLVPVSCLVCERDLRSYDFALEFHPPASWPAGAGEFGGSDVAFALGAGIVKSAPVLCSSCWLTLEPAAAAGVLPGSETAACPVQVISSFFTNDPLLVVIRFLKFSGGKCAVPALGWWMASALRRAREPRCAGGNRWGGAGVDPLLVPVPLHPARERARGYNQAALLAADVGERLGIEVGGGIVERSKETRSQSTLETGEREENVRGAFRLIREDAVRHRDIIVVDDLITTGATVRACAEALRTVPLRSLAVLSAGRTRGLL